MMCTRRAARIAVAAAVAALALAGNAAAATTVTTGVLTNALGMPTAGTIRLYATPLMGGVSPLIATAQAGPDGGFTLTAPDSSRLVDLAQARHGWLDWVAVADTGGYEGVWGWTSYIQNVDGAVLSVPPETVAARGSAKARLAGLTRIGIVANRRQPAYAAAAQGHCVSQREERPARSVRKLAVVGELNNAWNDGTEATFYYGRGGESGTEFGLSLDAEGTASISLVGERYAAFKGTTRFPTIRRRFARRMRTGFEFTHFAVRNNTCAVWDHYVKVTDWLANQDMRTKQKGTLNRCIPAAFGHRGFPGGGGFETENSRATRWNNAVRVFGASLTAQSGFDERVGISYTFGGRERKQHYLCGPDGRQSPARAGRIFSGAVRR